MSPVVSCRSIAKAFGAAPLFENVSIVVSDGDRLGLIGPNGSGKTTLLKILAGAEEPDSGERSIRKLARLGYVPQDSFYSPARTVRQVLEDAVPDHAAEDLEARLNTTLGAAGLTGLWNHDAAKLSGGWRKRLAIAEALIAHPDVLMLDEPTNHLDLAGILWLERLLAEADFACVVVSHDRYFLENVATSMAELSRQYPEGIFRSEGAYSQFLEKRAQFLESQAKLEASLAVRVRREIEWLRRGAKARTSKSKARIDEAHRLIRDLDDVSGRNKTSTASIDFSASDRKTKKLVETTAVTHSLGGRRLIAGLNLKLTPGIRLGIVGPNGSGKTTLLRLLLGEFPPDEGSVFRADNLQMVYFDQNREQLDPEVSLKQALAEHGDSVIYRGRALHVAGWAKRFLFREEQLGVAVGRLSGGERARVLIARLMLREADVLFLDEPTNDLDIPTLEVLEESLLDFPGALVLVTHDRYLLDRVSTAVLGLDGEGGAILYADYAQWEQDMGARRKEKVEKSAPAEAMPRSTPPARKKLSYLDAREFEQMEGRILAAEEKLEEMKALLQAPDVVSDGVRLQQVYADMQSAQVEVDRLYARWAELEAAAGS
ncbi:MAG: ABC-F family ATP-binding cassette domain-containing protein [Bryobacteraceae bacterium]